MTTRRDFVAASAAVAGLYLRPSALSRARWQAARPAPSAAQLAWQQDEVALFLHFGVNTFTDREWGDGKEDPAMFAPARLDARQWTRAAKAAGAKALILTAKHHDGFCLWPTKTTDHSVAKSPFRGGKGDAVKEFTDACKADGLKAGLYLSPWDRNNPAYGDSPTYNDLYIAQLTELLTQYGPIAEVWFDGANGEGPNGKSQVYDWPRVWALVRRLQPNAVTFSDAGPDVRWIGNENGVAGETNWSTVDPAVVSFPGQSGPGVMEMLQRGDPNGSVWRPGETDVSIRPGWFYHPADDLKVKTVDQLVDLYFTSVGRNSKLLLNVPPTRDGRLHDADVNRLSGMRDKLNSLFHEDLANRRMAVSRPTGGHTSVVEIELPSVATVGLVDLREDIAHGQAVSRYALEGQGALDWLPLAKGTTIGYKKLERFTPVMVRRLRVTIEDAAGFPGPVRVGVYAGT
jgi:alpha-L-fucosidase